MHTKKGFSLLQAKLITRYDTSVEHNWRVCIWLELVGSIRTGRDSLALGGE